MRAPIVSLLVLSLGGGLAACGGGGAGGDGGGGGDGVGGGDGSGAGVDGAPDAPGAADAADPDAPQHACLFRVRFQGETSVLGGECRTYTPVPDRFDRRVDGPCVFTADASLGLGTTVIEETGTVTVVGAAAPGTPITSTPDVNAHYARTVPAVIADVGDAITFSSTGGAVPAIPEVTLARVPPVIFEDRPAATISKAAGWTVPYRPSSDGLVRVFLSQNMGNVYFQSVCTGDATGAALVIPPEALSSYFFGSAFATFDAFDEAQTTAGAHSVSVVATSGVELAAGGPLTGMSISFID